MDMRAKVLTLTDVTELSGLKPNTVKTFIGKGAVVAFNSRMGPGHHQTFSLLDAVALAYARPYLSVGIPHGLVANVVRVIAASKPEDLEAAFTEGRTFMLPWEKGLNTGLTQPAEEMAGECVGMDEEFNLERVYRRIVNEQVAIRNYIGPKSRRRGRRRGLCR